MLNGRNAPIDTPRSIWVILSLDFDRFHRSSGARHASNRSSASVLQISPRAQRSRSIGRSRCSSGKSCAQRSASAKNSSSRFAAAQASMISSNPSLTVLQCLRGLSCCLFATPLLVLSLPALICRMLCSFHWMAGYLSRPSNGCSPSADDLYCELQAELLPNPVRCQDWQ